MKIAIDIVLTLPKDIISAIFQINKEIVKAWGDKLILKKGFGTPHISILMWCIDEKNIPALISELKNIAKRTASIPLKIQKTAQKKLLAWDTMYSIRTSKPRTMKILHKKIFGTLLDKLSFDAKAEMLSPQTKSLGPTLEWINGHRKKSDYKFFHPHIMVWIWWDANPKINFPQDFISSHLAIYQ